VASDRRGTVMATRQTQGIARLMRAPAIILLLIWMI
jgi:sorbitol/mannitol transport system permease protein